MVMNVSGKNSKDTLYFFINELAFSESVLAEIMKLMTHILAV